MNWLRRYVRYLQRRWIAHPVERDEHETVVRERLARRLPEAEAHTAEDDAADLGGSSPGDADH